MGFAPPCDREGLSPCAWRYAAWKLPHRHATWRIAYNIRSQPGGMQQRRDGVGGADARPYVFVHITLECEKGVRTLQLLLKLVCELAKLGLRVNVWCVAPLLAARSPFLHHYPSPLRPRPPPSPSRSAIPIPVSACAARARACVRVGRETGRVERHRKGSNCASFIASRTSSGPRTCPTQPPRALLPLGMSRRSRSGSRRS